VAEEFALEQGFRDGGTVDGDKGLAGAQAAGVNGAGHEFFAGSTLAANENGGIAFRYARDKIADAAHGFALADERAFGFDLGAEALVLGAQRIELQQVLQRDGGDAGYRTDEVGVILFEGGRRGRRVEVNHSQSSVDRDQGHAQHMLGGGGSSGSGNDHRAAFPNRLLHQLFSNDDLGGCQAFSIPGAGRTGFLVRVALKNNCGLGGGNHFANQLQQLALQGLNIAGGIDDIGNLQECRQIARHSADPGIVGGQAAWIERHRLQFGGRARTAQARCEQGSVVLGAGEEHKLALADANAVSMLQRLAGHLRFVDESSVVAVEIGDFKNAAGDLAHRAMLS